MKSTVKQSLEAKTAIIEFTYPFLRTFYDQIQSSKKNTKPLTTETYSFNFTPQEFNGFKDKILSMKQFSSAISNEETINVDDWFELIERLNKVLSLFQLKRTLFKKSYQSDTRSLEIYVDSIYDYLDDKDIDPIKNSLSYFEKLRSTPVKTRLLEDIILHNHTMDLVNDEIDFN